MKYLPRLNRKIERPVPYAFGFSLCGFLAFALQELPYLPWALWPPPNNPLAGNTAPYLWLEIAEKVAGILTVVVLIFIVRKNAAKFIRNRFFLLAAICLTFYYASWIAYFAGCTNGWLIVLGLSALAPIYYLCVALGLQNKPAVIPCAIFIVVHTSLNTLNFLL